MMVECHGKISRTIMNSKKLRYRVLFSHTDNTSVEQNSLSVYKYGELRTILHLLILPPDIEYVDASILCVDVQNALNRGIDMNIVVEYCLL